LPTKRTSLSAPGSSGISEELETAGHEDQTALYEVGGRDGT
jgi:hypothetical protein